MDSFPLFLVGGSAKENVSKYSWKLQIFTYDLWEKCLSPLPLNILPPPPPSPPPSSPRLPSFFLLSSNIYFFFFIHPLSPFLPPTKRLMTHFMTRLHTPGKLKWRTEAGKAFPKARHYLNLLGKSKEIDGGDLKPRCSRVKCKIYAYEEKRYAFRFGGRKEQMIDERGWGTGRAGLKIIFVCVVVKDKTLILLLL